jgi:hypothetical protein
VSIWLPVITGGSESSFPAGGEDVAHLVDADAATGVFAPFHEQVARLPIEIGQRQPFHTALLGGADLRELHQAVPQPVAVDADVRGHAFLPS